MRLLSSSKHAPRLIKMGLTHGKHFDCQQEECRVCLPFRVKEKEIWDEMSEEERKQVVWSEIG